MALAKKYRLAKKKCIDQVFKEGKTVQGSFFFVKIQPNNLNIPRIAVVVSKKASVNKVSRNRTKRKVTSVIYEYVRGMNIDMVLVVTLPILGKSQDEIKSELEQTMNKFKVKSLS